MGINIEKRRARARARYKKTRETISAATREAKRLYDIAYRAAHKEEKHLYNKKYIENNKEKIKKQQAAAHALNPEKRRLRRSIYYENNKERESARNKDYIQRHPEINRASGKRHRALKRGAAISDFTAAQWHEMQENYGHRCAYCGKRAKGKLTQDHITPISDGGNHTLANIVPACRSCNSKKHKGPPLAPVQPLLITIAKKKRVYRRRKIEEPPHGPA